MAPTTIALTNFNFRATRIDAGSQNGTGPLYRNTSQAVGANFEASRRSGFIEL
ncbi:MAG: hypothetical protein HN617_07040 [Planctomycetaceae bacterium]|jgi:hypothetical protein|nr:hypothetical protein [Planctomycetaceae bacterium]MBT5599828.1 hypothetical protein [Planctomycetaceae bacterium]MBT5884081.1 hypothetical protein [Planctomycetaceae bacterium]MBT6847545.1 hypothetical protein [Planctomycetaceae bacterium]MBT7255713.1 hypothetical protein [Planctomycetaceae bacterium]